MKLKENHKAVRIAVIPLLVVITILGLTGTSFGGEKAVSAAGANWLGTWQNRVQIAVDHTKIGSTLSDIPVMVHLSASSGENTANLTSVFQSLNSDSNRKKIAVTTSDGTTQCYVEIESWDSASGQAWVWVKIPSLSSSADTVLYLYYDAAQPDNTTYVGDTGSVAAQSVWSNHFVMVLHLNQSGSGASGEYIDSTSNGNNGRGGGGSSSATPIKVSSPFGSSQSFDGSNDYIEVPDNDAFSITTTGALTVSAWISPAVANFNGSDPYIRWMGKGNSSAQQEWQFVMYNQSDPSRSQWISFYTYSPSGGLGAGDYSTGAVATNSWVYVTGVAQSTSTTQGTESIYRNAAVHSGNPDSWQKYGLTYANGTAPVRIGMQYAGGGNFNGRIGEVTISNVTRSADWIKASYYSESDALLKYTASTRNATVTLGGLSQTYDGTAKTATVVTNPVGLSVTLTYNGSMLPPTAAGNYTVVGTIVDANYQGSAIDTMVIAKATPIVSWVNPSNIIYGTPLSGTQLKASANVPGGFVYSPAAGSLLSAGVQSLSATFTPTDGANYATSTSTVNINVTKKTITPSVAVANKSYDATTSATIVTRSLSGVIGNDTVNLTGGIASFDTAVVGSGKTVTVTGLSLSGAAAGNYILSSTSVTTTASIIAPTPSDLNSDGHVNVFDMIIVGQHSGEIGSPGWIPEDISQDGVISVLDQIIIGQNWTG